MPNPADPLADTTDEPALVRLARSGDAEAFGELVRRYQTSVYNVCFRLMRERRDAEDLAQEAFIRAYERLDTFEAGRPFGPWIRRVAANLCLNRLASAAGGLGHVSLDDERDEAAEPGGLAGEPQAAREQAEEAEALRAALLSLPAHYRAVIELRHFQEMSYAEIASALDLPLSDVKSHLFRARRLLSQKLNPYGRPTSP